MVFTERVALALVPFIRKIVPLGEPLLMTGSGKEEKFANTLVLEFMVTVHTLLVVPTLAQTPAPHPANSDPLEGIAVKVADAPAFICDDMAQINCLPTKAHPGVQLLPPLLQLMLPLPNELNETE